MTFVLFLLLNALLLIRPEELFPDLAGASLYMIVIGLTLLLSFDQVLPQLESNSLRDRPITFGVMAIGGCVLLSLAARGWIDRMFDEGVLFGKVILYYLLLVAVVNSVDRLRMFLVWVAVCAMILTGLALLQYHDIIQVDALVPVDQRDYDADGNLTVTPRLCSSGIFNDPNDLCLILVSGIVISFYRFERSGPFVKPLWLLISGVFLYGVFLTYSRGGFLALVVALSTLVVSRFGARRTLPVMAILGPILLVAFGGRQTNINLDEGDTAQERIRLWSDGLVAMQQPRHFFTGIGVNEYADEVGLVAHNSFVHAYVEMGLLGGGFFLGTIVYLFSALRRVGRQGIDDPELKAMRPYLMALAAGYAAGMFSVSRNYVVPTYLIWGTIAAFLNLTRPYHDDWYAMNGQRWRKLVVVTIVGYVGLKLLTVFLVRF